MPVRMSDTSTHTACLKFIFTNFAWSLKRCHYTILVLTITKKHCLQETVGLDLDLAFRVFLLFN